MLHESVLLFKNIINLYERKCKLIILSDYGEIFVNPDADILPVALFEQDKS